MGEAVCVRLEAGCRGGVLGWEDGELAVGGAVGIGTSYCLHSLGETFNTDHEGCAGWGFWQFEVISRFAV